MQRVNFLLAIDPGRCTGWALFDGRTLIGCGLDPSPAAFESIDRVVIEYPIYRSHERVSPNDLIKLALNAGEWGGLARASRVKPEYVLPHVWKGGSIPKEISHERIKRKCNSTEWTLVKDSCVDFSKSTIHNVIDAVGIGLWAIGRKA